MKTAYTFKQSTSKLWSAYRGKELICGGYLCQNDAVIALAKWINYNRLQEELLSKGIEKEKIAFKTYEQLLEIEADFNRFTEAKLQELSLIHSKINKLEFSDIREAVEWMQKHTTKKVKDCGSYAFFEILNYRYTTQYNKNQKVEIVKIKQL